MYEEILAALKVDASNLGLPEHVRRMAENLHASVELYLRSRFAEARRPTDPAGNQQVLVRPKQGG